MVIALALTGAIVLGGADVLTSWQTTNSASAGPVVTSTELAAQPLGTELAAQPLVTEPAARPLVTELAVPPLVSSSATSSGCWVPGDLIGDGSPAALTATFCGQP